MKKILLFYISVVTIASAQPLEQNSGVTANLTCVSIYNIWNVWICGNSGTVIKTSNEGLNWVNKTGNGIPTTIDLNTIASPELATALTAGNVGSTTYMYRTTNSGNNWTQVFSQTNGHINSIKFKSPTLGFMYGDPVGGRWSLWKTTNGGLTWDSVGLYLNQTGTEKGFANSMFLSYNRIYFGTDNYHIYYSSNYGASWVTQSTGIVKNTKAISFNLLYGFYSDTLFGNAGGNRLLKTTNLGMNWDTAQSIGAGDFGGFCFGRVNQYPQEWYVRNDNKLYFSSGGNWTIVYTSPSGNYNFISDNNLNQTEGWAIRDNGGITRFTAIYETGVKKILNAISTDFSLFQNYPNPFNPSTKIKFSIPLSRGVDVPNPRDGRGVFTKLVIYNVLGKEITELVNQQLHPGTYEVEWDGSEFTSGIYYLRLETENYSECRKIVLIK